MDLCGWFSTGRGIPLIDTLLVVTCGYTYPFLEVSTDWNDRQSNGPLQFKLRLKAKTIWLCSPARSLTQCKLPPKHVAPKEVQKPSAKSKVPTQINSAHTHSSIFIFSCALVFLPLGRIFRYWRPRSVTATSSFSFSVKRN